MRWPVHIRRECAEDSGQTTVLVVGLSAVCLLLATVILAATAVNIEARRLLSVADGAAAAAAAGAAPPAGAEPTLEPTLVMRFFTSTPSSALANRPGQ